MTSYSDGMESGTAALERLLDTQDKGLLVIGCPLLRGVARDALEEVVRDSTAVVAYRGQTLMEEGELATDVFHVVKGRIELRVESISPNMEVEIAKLGEGEVFGETILLDEQRRHVTAVASEPSILLQIPAVTLRGTCRKNPQAGAVIYRNAAEILAARLRRANQRMVTYLRRLHY
ncbi:MAG: family transcriptional regulator, cyclic receptor protein [Candidatus Sumerlaeota bacterium]|nr:family transcriptional regulator, cyclic receptor protein [Candidatus Sumerlaeota bacterium]